MSAIGTRAIVATWMFALRGAWRVSPLAVILFAASCDGERSPIMPSPTPAGGRIAVLGDSLAVSPDRSASFPAVLQARLTAEGLPWTVSNAGVIGDTTAGGLARLDAVLVERPHILIVALGANDGLRGTDVGVIRRNLSQIISRATSQNTRVLLCGMETPPWRGWDYFVEFHRVFPDLAREHGVPLVPFFLAGVVGNPDLSDDLVHPNAAGARRIAETIWPFLLQLVRTEPKLTVT